jgi:hypothetical protein
MWHWRFDLQIEPWKFLIEKDIFRLSQKRILQWKKKIKTSICSVQITSICFYFRNSTICEVRETSIILYLCWMQSLYGKFTSKLLNLCNSINAKHFLILYAVLDLLKQFSLSWWLFERIEFYKVTLLVVASATQNGWVVLGGCLKGERVLRGDFILARHILKNARILQTMKIWCQGTVAWNRMKIVFRHYYGLCNI